MASLLDRLKDQDIQRNAAQYNEPVRARLQPNQANLQTRLNSPAIQNNAAEQAQALRGRMAKPPAQSNLQTRLNTTQAPGGRIQLKPPGNSSFKLPALANQVSKFGGAGPGMIGLGAAESIYSNPLIQEQMQRVSKNIQDKFGSSPQNTVLGEMPTNARLFGDTTGQGSLTERIQGGLTDALYNLDPAGIRANEAPALAQRPVQGTASVNTRLDVGPINQTLTSTPPALAKPQGALNIFGEPVQNLSPSGTYMVGDVENIPWDLTDPDVLARTLSKEQFLDYMGQGNVVYDDEGNPTRTPMTLNPALDPQTKDLAGQLARANIDRLRQPAQKKFNPAFSDDVLDSLPVDINPALKQRARTIPKDAWEEFNNDISSAKQSDVNKYIEQFSEASGVSSDIIKSLLYR